MIRPHGGLEIRLATAYQLNRELMSVRLRSYEELMLLQYHHLLS